MWELALQVWGGGAFTGPPASPAPSSCTQSVVMGAFPLPAGDSRRQGPRPWGGPLWRMGGCWSAQDVSACPSICGSDAFNSQDVLL